MVSPKSGIMVAIVALATALAVAWLVATYRENDSRARLPPDRVMTLFPDPRPLTPFALTDHRQRDFNLARLQGKWSFLFFGFTHCPDICPTTLAEMARVRDEIARSTAGVKDVQFVFVSVDPGRDTAARLGQYVGHFHADFVGVRGEDAQIRNLAGQLGAEYRVEVAPGVENYPVFHAAAVFLLDPRARYHAVFTSPHDAEVISRRFEVLRKLAGAGAA